MITAALDGTLHNVGYRKHSVFHVEIPATCPGVPSEVLSPRETWKDDDGYYKKANQLAEAFNKNFTKFADYANDEIMAAAPRANVNA